ncbi:MAG: carboxylesterase family protein, partial [Terracidiphilus sp.]
MIRPICNIFIRRSAGLLLACAVLALCFIVTQAAQGQTDPLVVTTTAGKLRGRALPGGGAEFLGIPYAQPPVGDLRWRSTVTVQPWSGIREATAFSAPCEQPLLYGNCNHYDVDRSSEDCLYLN